MAYLNPNMLTNSQVFLHWPARHGRSHLLSRAWARIQLWRDRVRQRGELARLGERDLHDLGRSAAEVNRELAKWFWQE